MAKSCAGWEGVVHVGPYNRELNLYSDFQSLLDCKELRPNGELSSCVFPSVVKDKKKCLIIRTGTDVSYTTHIIGGGGLIIGIIEDNLSSMSGKQLGYTDDGIPVYVGAPLTPDDMKYATKQNTPLRIVNFKPGGTPQQQMVTMIPGVTELIIIAITIIFVAGAVAYSMRYVANITHDMAEIERTKLASHAADLISESTKIQDDTTVGIVRTIVLNNGQVYTINVDPNSPDNGKIISQTEPPTSLDCMGFCATCPQDYDCDCNNKKCTKPADWTQNIVLYSAIIIGGAVILYIFLRSRKDKKKKA